MSVAIISIRGKGVFEADTCRIDGPWVHAEGRWRWRHGPNDVRVRFSEPETNTWSAREVRRIRWAEGMAA